MSVPSDIEIARAASLRPIEEVAARLGIPPDALHHYGRHIAKLDTGFLRGLGAGTDGKLVLVTAINPTPAGEGKTTTTVGLGDGLNRIGKRAAICLREPSLGPCFGMKGGAAGGGYAQVVPMEQINLHFTGDFHAIGSAHNLLAALLDNHVYWGNALGHRRAAGGVAAGARHERPRAAPDRLEPGRGAERLPARGRVRHHRGLRGHGGVLPRARPRGSRGPARADGRRLHARQEAGHGGGPEGAGRHGGPAARRADAQPRPDARGQPGLRPRRAVRQHRARLQLRHGDPDRAQARRLRRHRGRLRRRPRGGEVLRHQVPQGRAGAGRGGDRRHRAARSRCTAAWPRASSAART